MKGVKDVKIEQAVWTENNGWKITIPKGLGQGAQLVLVFGETSCLKKPEPLRELRDLYPKARLFGCSTAGEISGTQVLDDSLAATAIRFDSTEIKIAGREISNIRESMEAGRSLAACLDKKDLVHAFVLSDGLSVNGSALVEGLIKELPPNVTVTGGLSGDKDRFRETLVFCDGEPERNQIGILGFYSKSLKVGYGSIGGWDPFGPERLVTRSEDNILYELDGKSSLGLYKNYLGEHAKGLPATALLFPLSIRSSGRSSSLVRTVLSVNEEDQSMIFAGDIPQGSYARFMKANINRLIDGAMKAAEVSSSGMAGLQADLAILISCVGRKMVLKQRVEEEVEGVQDILGSSTSLTGFYSYGEMSPTRLGEICELHNQTMTITTFLEE